jgi:hypothetical protein
MRPPERRALAVLLVTGIAAGLGFAFAPPRLTLVNAAVRVAYPWSAVAGGALAGLCAGALAALARRLSGRAALAAVAAACLVLALGRAAFAIEAGGDAVTERGLLRRTALPWREVSRVESDEAAIAVWSADGRHVRIETARLRPEQRAALERTVSRRVRGGQPAVR